MITALVGSLLMMLAGWLAFRLGALRTENANLRARVDSLKRQLLRMR